MSKEVYKKLLEVMKNRGGSYSGMDIPEFYEMAEALFTLTLHKFLKWVCRLLNQKWITL